MAEYRLAEDGDNLKDAINRILKRDSGTAQFGTRIRWTDFSGDVLDRQTGQVIGTSEPTLVIQNGAGEHILVKHSSGSPNILEVQDSGVTMSSLSVPSLHLTGTLDVDGNVTLGNASTDTVTVTGPVTAQNTLTVRNGAAGTIYLLVDPANARVLVGNNGVALTGASSSVLEVTGNAYVAGTLSIWNSAAAGGGWTLDPTADSNGDLVFKDDGAAERFRIGDTSSTWAAKATGPLNATGNIETGGNLVMNSSGYLQLGSSTVASSGTVRGPATMTVKSRNAANSADITLIEIDGSNNVFVGNGCTVGILYTGTSQRVRWDSTGVGFNGSGTVAKPTLGAAAGAAYGAGEQSLLNNIRSCLQNVGLAN